MIRNTFLFLDRIGLARERMLWQLGITSWQSFLEMKVIRGLSAQSKLYYDRQIAKASAHLNENDSSFFAENLRSNEHWRLYDYFRGETVFLDIETTGLDEGSQVTVVGLYDGHDSKTMIKGINLDFRALEKELSNYKLIVTFNGASFDVPFLRKYMSIPNIPHFDLRFGCKRIGLSGGLKKIEKDLGIRRPNEIVAQLNGGDAITLWRMYMASGDSYYLDLLVEYNEEDIINLKPLADHVFSKLKEGLSRQQQFVPLH